LRCQDLLQVTALRTSQLPVLADGAAIRAVLAPAQLKARKQRINGADRANFGVSSKFM
jgi:hypothetical protein